MRALPNQILIAALFLFSVIACREGRFENRRQFNQYDRVSIALESAKRTGDCEPTSDDPNADCDSLEVELKLVSRLDQEPIRYRDMELEVSFAQSEESFYQTRTQSDADGAFKFELNIEHSKFLNDEAIPLLFAITPEDLGRFEYTASFFAEETAALDEWRIYSSETPLLLPQIAGRSFRLDNFQLETTKRASATPAQEIVDFELSLQLFDLRSGLVLSELSFELIWHDLREEQSKIEALQSDQDGWIHFKTSMIHQAYGHQSLRRVDLVIKDLSASNRPSLRKVLIIDPSQNLEPVRHLWDLADLEDHPEWVDRSYLVASTESQEIELRSAIVETREDLAILEIDAFFTREGFNSSTEFSVANLNTRIRSRTWIYVPSTESWRIESSQEDSLEGSPRSPILDIRVNNIRAVGADSKRFFEIEISLTDLLHIPTQSFFLDSEGKLVERPDGI